MELNDIATLAASMVRLHGIERALKLADRYATDYAANADARGYDRWATVAASLAELLEKHRRFGKAARA